MLRFRKVHMVVKGLVGLAPGRRETQKSAGDGRVFNGRNDTSWWNKMEQAGVERRFCFHVSWFLTYSWAHVDSVLCGWYRFLLKHWKTGKSLQMFCLQFPCVLSIVYFSSDVGTPKSSSLTWNFESFTLSRIIMEVDIYPNWKETRIAGTRFALNHDCGRNSTWTTWTSSWIKQNSKLYSIHELLASDS